MFVRPLPNTPTDGALWDAYVQRADAATSDHCWGWRRVLTETFGYESSYLGAFEDDRLVGILPLFKIPRGLGRWALSSIPFGNYGGVCADSSEAADALLDAAKQLTHQTKSQYLELRHVRPWAHTGLHGQTLYSRFRYPLDPADIGTHFKRLSRNARANVRRAMQGGIYVVPSHDVEALYPVHVDTMRRLGTPCFPKRYFETIVAAFGDQVEIALLKHKDRVIGYELVLYFKRSMVCQFNGSLAEYFSYRPNQMRFWDSVEKGIKLGLTELDYCRSRKDSGSSEFKRRLQFVEEPLGYQYYLPNGGAVPQRNPSNPKYQMVIRAWQRLPLALTELLGPPLIRYLA